MWQVEQLALPKNSCSPAVALPVGADDGCCTDRRYAMISVTSSFVSWFGGIAVPGTPDWIVRVNATSDPPCVQVPAVKSGPRMPPRAPTPWQKTHSCRNRIAPCLTLPALTVDAGGPCARTCERDATLKTASAA